ncbi:MAG: hypothetical protein NC230_04630 [Bacteroides sp.]|nr:hypothetical protein [Bacteroides sp.]
MEHNNILDKLKDGNGGMTVPDGYFESFEQRMCRMLPKQEWEEPQTTKVMPKTVWQKVRPYVYLAAMFLGIWCMMQMFDMMRVDPMDNQITSNKTLMAAISNDNFYYDIVATEVSDNDLYDDLYEQGFDPDDMNPSK